MKQVKEPKEYGGDKSQFREWREQLHSYLTMHCQQYVKLLIWIEGLGKNPFTEDDQVSLANDIVSNKSPQAYRAIKTIMKTWTNIGMVNQEMARDMTAAVWDSEEFRDRAEAFVNREEQTPRSFTGSQPVDHE